MTQGFIPLVQFLLLLLFIGHAMAGVHLWSSVHVALSHASVFVNYSAHSNMTDSQLTMDLIDIDKNVTLLKRSLPFDQSIGYLEFDCTHFLYAGNFSFRLEQTSHQGALNRTYSWWSPILRVHWPTFHIGLEHAHNHSTRAFQITLSTNSDFHVCTSSKTSFLYLEVSYLEHNQIGKNAIDKVQKRTRHDIQVVKSLHVELECASFLTEAGFIRVALKSSLTQEDIKSSGPLYLSRIFSYKLQVENIYRSGCEGAVSVRLRSPPCTVTTGKVLLYKEANTAAAQATPAQLAFHFLSQGENETEFNCSLFDLGRNKYCFHFALIYSQSPSSAQMCIIVQRNAVEMWGPWQTWSGCSVTCGEGVRERVRTCLLPPSGGYACTGMVREQSLCSLESCDELLPSASFPPPRAVDSSTGGNLVVVAGISLCLVVILVTVLIAVWRKLCHTKCRLVHSESVQSGCGRKNSDEAAICEQGVQRPSFSESLQAVAPQKSLTHPSSMRAASDKGVLACHQSFSSSVVVPQDPERLSPSGQKIAPPVFGYRLAQQQLKEMKKKGLKEATQVYHVSQSPIDDTMLEATASTSAGLTPVPQEFESQEETDLGHFRKSAFLESTWPHKTSAPFSDGLSPKVDLILNKSKSLSDRDQRQERTADWVAMVERCRLSYPKNPNFRRTSSFNECNWQQQTKSRPFRERSLTQVAPRQLPEGSCRTRTWEHSIPEMDDCSQPKYRIPDSDYRRRPWVDAKPSLLKSKPDVLYSATLVSNKSVPGMGQAQSSGMDRVERAEQIWSKRGPSPIQRNLLARKLREANSSKNSHRQRSSTFSSSDQCRGRCRSLPLSADYSSSSYGLTEDEQRMMDISGYLGEEEGIKVMKDHRLT